jgi:lipopolysaccharide transport system ATP-binding protein
MSEIIKVNNLTKTYRLYKKPSDRLKSFFFKNIPFDTIDALKDISFSVVQNETLGIIGENGAGKSTLLKVLSGVLTPTQGQVQVNGKILSILELGVGFHPEFTGRDNIFFYGDVLGFGRDFIRRKTDEIIDFSELGLFIDKPIKTYSSGMIVRLAFSTVSSFEPDVLILDEVLAVGDTHFQRKSLNRMIEFKNRGKTIIFCSHDAYQIRMLCDKAIWLKQGKVADIGEPERVIYNYESYQMRKEVSATETRSSLPVMITEVKLLNEGTIKTFDDIRFGIVIKSDDTIPYHIMLSLKISTAIGICAVGTHLSGMRPLTGSKTVTITFPKAPIIRGSFYAHARVYDESGVVLYHEKVTPFFEVIKDVNELGFCYMPCKWDIE